jgi:hypothetical protein
MRIMAFEPWHIEAMNVQASQRAVLGAPMLYLHNLAQSGPAYSAVAGSRLVVCGGCVLTGFGTGHLWAVLAENAPLLAVHRAGLRLLDMLMADLRRIESSTEAGFAPGCRWLTMLGFQSEGLMRAYGPAGEDHMRFARCR